MAQSVSNTTLPDVHAAAARIIEDHGYGALDKTAGALGKSPDVLGKKLREEGTHKLSDREASAIADFWNDDRLAQAHAARRGKILVAVPSFEGIADTELMECITRFTTEVGDVCRSFHESMADRRITAEDVARFRAELRQCYVAGEEWANRMESLVEPEKAPVALATVPSVKAAR